PGSAVMGYDENRWATRLSYSEQSAEDALELFKWLRLSSYKLIRTVPEETWSHTIEHSENGTMTLDDWLNVYARHVSDHIEQMQKGYAAWLQRSS
ncbi:MAG TPA: DinB family protein, partial [Anaerolineae bacterium]